GRNSGLLLELGRGLPGQGTAEDLAALGPPRAGTGAHRGRLAAAGHAAHEADPGAGEEVPHGVGLLGVERRAAGRNGPLDGVYRAHGAVLAPDGEDIPEHLLLEFEHLL